MIIDFDKIDVWDGPLTAVLSPALSSGFGDDLAARQFPFLEDSRDHLFSLGDRDEIIDRALDFVRTSSVAAYHGTRLSVAEVESIRERGLIPLRATDRRIRLERALSKHRRWPMVGPMLNQQITQFGSCQKVGRREGQVHLTASRAGLLHGFNHYLIEGSEFDSHVAHELLGKEGVDLLKADGLPYVVRALVPGSAALAAFHPYFSVEETRRRGDLPNFVGDLIAHWAFRRSRPEFQPASQKLDRGLVFREAVPADWIADIVEVTHLPAAV